MASYYDDNFGHWEGMDGDDPDAEENRAFYRHVQRRSRVKKCAGCGRRVRLMPDYDVCDSCADKRERGGDL